jgi:uncharacterized protein YfaP (DUF2135 family)
MDPRSAAQYHAGISPHERSVRFARPFRFSEGTPSVFLRSTRGPDPVE